MRRIFAFALSCVVLASAAATRAADPPLGALTGTLARVARTGVVKLGYREDAAPFSFVAKAGVPAGYSIDLCREVVEAVREAVGGRSLVIEFVRVSAADRIDRVSRGEVDLECGSTTNTLERRARVAFSPTIFIAGTKLAVRKNSRIRALRDLEQQRVAVALVPVDDLAQGLALLAGGQVQALGGDDVLLVGELARSGRRGDYAIVGEYLSFERYGLVYARGDADMAEVVDARLRDLAASRELTQVYNKWFVRTLPNGVRLGIPMSGELRRSFELLGLPPE